FEVIQSFPAYFGDMQQSLFSGKEFYESSESNNAFNRSLVGFAYFGDGYNAFNPCFCFFDAFFIGRKNLDNSMVSNFFDIDGSTCFALDFLDDFPAWPDYSSDKF